MAILKIETAASKVSPELNWVLQDFKYEKTPIFAHSSSYPDRFRRFTQRLKWLHQKSAQNGTVFLPMSSIKNSYFRVPFSEKGNQEIFPVRAFGNQEIAKRNQEISLSVS